MKGFRLILFLLLLLAVLVKCSRDSLQTPVKVIDADIFLPRQATIDSFVFANRYVDSIFVNGSLVIGGQYDNDINDIGSLSKIKTINGDCSIIGTTRLFSLHGLENIKKLRGLYLFLNTNLANLEGFKNISALSGFLSIEANDALINLNGLEKLESIMGSFKLSNDHLVTINLPSLKVIGGMCDFEDIHPTTSISLNKLDTIKGDFYITHADHLSDFNGLNSLKYVGGRFTIKSNAINNFNGLNSLAYIGGEFAIHENENIINLSGLTNLLEIKGALYINGNNHLSSLAGIENIINAQNILIDYNPQLSDFCPIKPVIVRMMNAYPTTSPYQLFVFISNGSSLPEPYYHSNVLSDCP